MKKLFLSIALFLSLTTYAEKKDSEPSIIIEYNYVDKDKKMSLEHLQNDAEFCCYFKVVNTYNDTLKEDVIKVIDKESQIVLGVMFGNPNKAFLMHIYKDYFTKDKINDIVTKTNKYAQN